MSDCLSHWVVKILHVALCDLVEISAVSCLDAHSQLYIICAQIIVLKIWQQSRLLSWQSSLKWSQCFRCDHPSWNSGRKVLSQEWSEWNILPLLKISGTPVVEKTKSEDVVPSIFTFYGLAKFVSLGDDCSHFQLEIETFALTPLRCLVVHGDLPLWSCDWSSVENDRWSSSVIANWKVQPVWLKSIIGSSEHNSDVVCVVLWRVEVGVVTDKNWHRHSLTLDGQHGLWNQLIA